MPEPGSQFLHEKNRQLHSSTEVETVVDYLRVGGEAIPNQPSDKITAYLGFLAHAEYVNDGILTGDPGSIDRQVEAASVRLTKENAEAYVKFQAKVARELGRGGELDPDRLDDDAKMTALRLVRKEQQDQLREWAQELNSDENKYADWFKYWMFENIKRHTAFNDDLGKNGAPKGFEKRSGSSFASFPELDRESVSLVYDALVEKLGGQPMGFEYDNMRVLLDKANFSELYAEAQNYGFKITDKLKEVTRGSWHDFKQSDHRQDAEALSGLIRAYRTGWCTAGSETAHKQLSTGDFYVWCSSNPDTGRDEVPRIAVRMEQGVVAEVRGIEGGRRQELEPELADIVMDKIRNLPGGDTYFQKAEDMKRLTAIEKKVVTDQGIELADEELRFLYELDREIQSFGYKKDPRIGEIRQLRGDRDKPELARILPEAIREQVRSAYAAHRTVAERLGGKQRLFRKTEATISPNQLEQLFAAKDKEWQESGVYDYLVEQLIENGARYNLVVTPNIEASEQQIVALAEAFGKEQPYRTYVYNELYRTGKYSSGEWSGNTGNAPVRFSLIPNRSNSDLSGRTAEQQLQLLRELQAQRPELAVRVPSLLDAVTYWYTLRAQGDRLDDISAFDKTYIRHFDLEPKTLDGWPRVPSSCVHDDGRPDLGYSLAENDHGARVAVG